MTNEYQEYFKEEHEMLRNSIRSLVKKRILPEIENGKKRENSPGSYTRLPVTWAIWG